MTGFITVMDAVHMAYDRAPFPDRHLFIVKEGYPTVGVNITRILWDGSRTSALFFQTLTMTKRQCDLTSWSRPCARTPGFASIEFDTAVPVTNGQTLKLSGCMTLCDRGYHKCQETMCAMKYPLVGTHSSISSTVSLSNLLPFLPSVFSNNSWSFSLVEVVRAVASTHADGPKVEVNVQVHGVEFMKLVGASLVNDIQTIGLGAFVFRGNRVWRIVSSEGVEICLVKLFLDVGHLLARGNLAVLVHNLVKQRRKLFAAYLDDSFLLVRYRRVLGLAGDLLNTSSMDCSGVTSVTGLPCWSLHLSCSFIHLTH